MRTDRALAILATFTAAAAQGHHHHDHRRAHDHLLARSATLSGQRVTVTDNTRTDTTEVPEIVVFVDQNGAPVSTAEAVVVLVPPTGASLAEAVLETLTPSTIAVSSDATAEVGVSQQSSESPSVAASHASDAGSEDASGANMFGIAYAPYNADGSCKSANQIMQDFGVLGKSYGIVRVYSVDCGQVPNVYAAAKANKLKVMFGIYSLDDLGNQIATLTQGIKSDWTIVDTVSVGNELVNNGQASPNQVINAMNSARQLLKSAGYTGPVVTVDTFVAVLAHPELCQQSDYCACNIHPFFDPNTPASNAGTFVANQVQNIRNKLGNPSARVRVTESGWPWQGSANGQAVPGVNQQSAAMASIRSAFANNPADIVLFSAFNDHWKTPAASTFYAEQYWGIGTANAPSA